MPALLVLALMIVVPTAVADTDAADRLMRLSGTGLWATDGEATADARATWLVLDDQVHAFLVQHGNATYPCYDPLPSRADAAAADPSCSGSREGDATHLEWSADGTTWNGTFSEEERTVLLDATAPTDPSPVPGFVVVLLTVGSFAAAVVLLALYLQERRVARYLVRRLFEETQGRMPPDWPQDMRQQWIARIFIRGKN